MINIQGGHALVHGALEQCDITIAECQIAELGSGTAANGSGLCVDAKGLVVLPGIVDIHGDAFERQMMPRPGVDIDPLVALLDTDRQMLAAGVTTAMHGLTFSWEPGLRGTEHGVRVVDSITALKPLFGCDTHVHLRLETFNVDAEAHVDTWIDSGRLGALAFNDHTESMLKYLDTNRRDKLAGFEARTGLGVDAFARCLNDVRAKADEVPAFIERVAKRSAARGLPLLSHDDATPVMRNYYHALGCDIAEFPLNRETAECAASVSSHIVFGAPNVMRGGSHNNAANAAEMIGDGLCTILASDYYYPSMLQAALRLERDGIATLAESWRLVSGAPAEALGLCDRGDIALGRRADLVLIDIEHGPPRVLATIANGKPFVFDAALRLSGVA